MLESQSVLTVHDLSLCFGEEAPVISGLSFSIGPGESLGLIGPSGSGKSLTAYAMLGLLPANARACQGTAVFKPHSPDSIDLLQAPEKHLRQLRGRDIGMILQEPLTALNPVHRIADQLLEAARQYYPDKPPQEHIQLCQDWLQRVELGKEKDRILRSYPHQLSGGQRQRILIALSLMAHPKLLFADEPTTALDSITESEIVLLIHRLQKELDMALIFITHDPHLLSQMVDTVIHIQDGIASPPEPNQNVLSLTTPVNTYRPQRSVQVNPILSVKNIRIQYPSMATHASPKHSFTTAVDKVSFELYPNEWLAIVGPSGCGKTSIGRCLSGLLQPYEGNWEGPDKKGAIQLIFQDPYSSLNPSHSIEKSIREVLRVHHPAKEIEARIATLLHAVKLDPDTFAHRKPQQLSGGQRQRVAIARALAADPAILICDEAVSALDVPLRKDILKLLDEIRQREQLGLLFISHDIRLVAEYADRIIVMENGKIVEMGSVSQVTSAPQSDMAKRLIAATGLHR